MTNMRAEAILDRLISRQEKADDYTIGEIVDCYNIAMVRQERDSDQVKSFRDKPTAIRRLDGALAGLRGLAEIDKGSPGLKRLRSSSNAEAIRQDVLKDQVKAAKVARPQGGRRPVFADTDRITVVAQQNPKRGAAGTRYALYATSATVADYVGRVGNRGLALRDLTWDTRHKWIQVG